MDTSGFRVCVKELYETRYDPLSVSYVVFTGHYAFLLFIRMCDASLVEADPRPDALISGANRFESENVLTMFLSYIV